MKIAFIIFNDLTTLDFIGVYDPLTRIRTMKILRFFWIWRLFIYWSSNICRGARNSAYKSQKWFV